MTITHRTQRRTGVLERLTIFLVAGSFGASVGTVAAKSTEDLFELSLDELLELKVTSVSKKPQAISEAAAAVFVITSDDIRRSGVTTIPDALRLAPGVQVANIDGNKWAITARGFNALYANKLLVLIDGRTVYSPTFSGTFWDSQDTVLADIERIEVVRGPGATLWGSNAVNGVINIITRSANASRGTRLTAGVGNQENGYASLRHGGSLGDVGSYRVYAKHFDRDHNQFELAGTPARDDWHQSRLGFRADLDFSANDTLTLQGDAFRGDSGENLVVNENGPDLGPLSEGEGLRGHNMLGRWNHSSGSGDELTVQAFYDRSRANIDRYTLDLDIDYRTQHFDHHDLLLGIGYRSITDEFEATPRFALNPEHREVKLFSAFVQDDIALATDKLNMTLGLKIERNDFTGTEYQPNLRLMWTPNETSSIWGSVSRAVRIPGRAEQDGRALLDGSVIDGLGLPQLVYAQGNPDFEPEDLVAYELGLKQEVSDNLAFDVAAFYNVYDNLRSLVLGDPACAPSGVVPQCVFNPATTAVVIDGLVGNATQAKTHGLEVVTDWRPDPRWRFKATYSYLHQAVNDDLAGRNLAVSAGVDPRHQASLRAGFNPRSDVDLDVWLRYTDTVQYNNVEIDAYTALDVRLAWRPHKSSEFALVGRNLQTASQPQFESEDSNLPLTAMLRSVHLQLSFEF